MARQKTILTLSKTTQRLILSVRGHDRETALSLIEESLTLGEHEAVTAFFKWLDDNDREYGWNLPDVVKDWEKSQKKEA